MAIRSLPHFFFGYMSNVPGRLWVLFMPRIDTETDTSSPLANKRFLM